MTQKTQKKQRNVWTRELLIQKAEKVHGEGKLSYRFIPEDEEIRYEKENKMECLVCNFVWNCTPEKLIDMKRGCLWCRNGCKQLINCTLEMVVFIGRKRHGNKYTYENNQDILIRTTRDNFNVTCPNGHTFSEKIAMHISLSKKITPTEGHRGCPECNKSAIVLVKPISSKPWYRDLERLIKEGTEIHEGKYSYHLVTPEMIETSTSTIPIYCKTCTKEFNQVLSAHINGKYNCPHCSGRVKMNNEIFVERFKARYGEDRFILHIKPGDITSRDSMPIVECIECSYIIKTTTVGSFLHNSRERQCDRCNNNEPWTPEKLRAECERRTTEGEYSYENVDIDNFVGNNGTDISIVCLRCKDKGYQNYTFKQNTHSHFATNHGCPECATGQPWSIERFFNIVPKVYLEMFDYSLLKAEDFLPGSRYLYLNIICRSCGEAFRKQIGCHINDGQGCPFCTKSQGEKIVHCALRKNEIQFSSQSRCPNEKGQGNGQRPYRYDFECVYRGRNVIIEYDGMQHFQYCPGLQKDKDYFLLGRKRDIYKQTMAINNNFRFIRINYKTLPKNIEQVLMDALNSSEEVCYSNPSMYAWLDEGVNELLSELRKGNLDAVKNLFEDRQIVQEEIKPKMKLHIIQKIEPNLEIKVDPPPKPKLKMVIMTPCKAK